MSSKVLAVLSVLAALSACIPWTIDDDPAGPLDCGRLSYPALRYPGLCGLDGGDGGDGGERGDGGDGGRAGDGGG